MTAAAPKWPAIRTVGIAGMLVSFGDAMSEPANRAAIAFRAAIESEAPDGVEECSTSLVSTFVRFDPLHLSHAELERHLERLLATRDWYQAPLPGGRRLWRIPTVFGGDLAPQLGEAADMAGRSEAEAIAELAKAQVRVQTIGFAPGQPYLGELPANWDLPRQSGLTPQVPAGALVVALRQFVLFSNDTPTGWRHIGQTTFRLFRPEQDAPFVLRPGDETLFVPTSPDELNNMRQDPDGGAEVEALA